MKFDFPEFKVWAGLAGALCLLAGCVDVDKATAPTAREYWKPSKQALPNAPLNIELPPAASPVTRAVNSGQPLSLPSLVDMALENNPDTRQTWFSAKAAAAKLGESQAAYYPAATGTVSLTRARTGTINTFTPQGGVVGVYTTPFTAAAGLNWLLYDFGKRASDVGMARQALYAANFNYNQAIQDTVFNVQTAYYDLNAAMGRRAAAEANLADAKANYEAAKAKLDSGLGTSQDALQANAQVLKAQYEISGADADAEKARAQLASVLGLPVSSQITIEPVNEVPVAEYLDKQVGDLMAQALRERPILLAQYANLRQAEYAAASASADRWPKLVAFGQYDYNRVRFSGDDYSYNQWSAGIGLQWELFTGFQKTYALIGAKEQEKAARQAMRTAELQIVSDVWSYYYAFKSALSQIESAKAQVEAQSDAYEAISEGYRSGLNSFLDVLTASNDLANARQMYVQALASLGTSVAGLAHATGNMALTTPDSQLNAYRNQAVQAERKDVSMQKTAGSKKTK